MTVKISAVLATAIAFVAQTAHSDVSISNSPTQNMSCSGGVCSPTAPNAVLNVTDLANMLAASDIKVTTGSGAVNIDVLAALSWSSTSRLTLDANTNLNVQALVTVAGGGALTLTYNDGGSNGDLIFSNGGKVTFADLKSPLRINGNSYVLVSNIASLAHRIHKKSFGTYALANDYDASTDGTYSKPPIARFDGTFEGLGHTISNLRIVYTDGKIIDVGVIGINNGGIIRDLSLENEFVSAPQFFAGGLVGTQCCGARITHVFVSGDVQAGTAGGIAARTSGDGDTISYATAAVNVQGAFVGGLVGDDHGFITHCHATGSVTAPNGGVYVGGLAGEAFAVSFSSATGDVSVGGDARAAYVGGLVGYAFEGNIKQSYATGSVTGSDSDYVAGLTPLARNIDNSYALGSVHGGDQSEVGGLTGNAIVTSSYSTGFVSAGTHAHSRFDKPWIGGFTVFGRGTAFFRDYWDVDTSGTAIGCGWKNKGCSRVKGLTDAELRSGRPAGFKSDIWGWSPDINNGYPYLLANPPQ